MQAAFAQINRPDRFREKQIYRHSRIGFANNFTEMLLNRFGGQKGGVAELQFFDV
jgi:hypothetical protein